MAAKIGIDMGKGSNKYWCEFGHGEIPSYMARGSFLDVFSDPNAFPSQILYNGAEWIIGEDAPLGSNFIWKTDAEKGDERNLIFIIGILALLKVTEASIVVGLPVKTAQNAKEREAVKTRLSGFKTALVNGKSMGFDIQTNVLEEPLGTYFSLVVGDDFAPIKNSPLFTEEITVLDIGHRTVDIIDIRNGKLSSVKDSSMSGAVTMFDKAEKFLERQFGALKPNERVKMHSAIVNKFGQPLRINNEDVTPDFWTFVNKCKAQLARDITDEVKTILNNIQPDRIIVTGGGALLLRNQLLELNKNLQFHPNPKFANAEGFYKAAHIKAAAGSPKQQ